MLKNTPNLLKFLQGVGESRLKLSDLLEKSEFPEIILEN